MAQEIIKIKHKDGRVGTSTREALTKVWGALDWTEVSDTEAANTDAAANVTDGDKTDLSSLTRDQLREVAAQRGVTVEDSASKREVIAALS